MSMPVDIREQPEGINSLCHHVCSGIKLQQFGLMACTFRLGFISVKQSDLHKMSGHRWPCRLSWDAFSSLTAVKNWSRLCQYVGFMIPK